MDILTYKDCKSGNMETVRGVLVTRNCFRNSNRTYFLGSIRGTVYDAGPNPNLDDSTWLVVGTGGVITLAKQST